MKALVCEMCQSTELLKQDGVFVCQHCGTKYSVEEARKMMVEGSVEVQGVVEVKNTAQAENLMSLAKKSYESKNYAQAEEFCNQIIAMDGANYFAWKLKGEAINYQITGTNDRIEEVYNCIMTSYEVLDDAGKEEHREEILKSLRVCLEGEIDFALSLFLKDRPGDAMLKKVKNTFVSCANKVLSSYTKLGYSKEESDEYCTFIKNYFIKEVNKTCRKSWDSVVYYNYYREGLTDEYHPTREILSTYLNEANNLVALLIFASTYFTDKTPLAEQRENYLLQNKIHCNLVNATSYKRMVSTTRNGYGAVISRSEYWAVDTSLTEDAKAYHNKRINETCKLFDDIEVAMAKSDPKTRQEMIRKWTAERDAIPTGFKLGCGPTGFLIVCAIVVAFCAMVDMDEYSTIFGVIFGIAGVIGLIIGIAQGKKTQEDNLATIERINRKIRELDK